MATISTLKIGVASFSAGALAFTGIASGIANDFFVDSGTEVETESHATAHADDDSLSLDIGNETDVMGDAHVGSDDDDAFLMLDGHSDTDVRANVEREDEEEDDQDADDNDDIDIHGAADAASSLMLQLEESEDDHGDDDDGSASMRADVFLDASLDAAAHEDGNDGSFTLDLMNETNANVQAQDENEEDENVLIPDFAPFF